MFVGCWGLDTWCFLHCSRNRFICKAELELVGAQKTMTCKRLAERCCNNIPSSCLKESVSRSPGVPDAFRQLVISPQTCYKTAASEDKGSVSTQKPDITWSHGGTESLGGPMCSGRSVPPQRTAAVGAIVPAVRLLNNAYWRRLRCGGVCVLDRRTQLSAFYCTQFGRFLCRVSGADPLQRSSEIWSRFLFSERKAAERSDLRFHWP